MPPEPPVLGLSRRKAVLLVLAAVAATASLLLLLPAVADVGSARNRLAEGDARWLLLALGLEVVSFLGHIALFRAVAGRGAGRIGLRASTEITLAGHAAARLFASGGAGGVALTAWALRRSGLERAEVAARMTTFLVLLYAVYMAALVVGGLGLWLGLLPGSAPLGLTLVPAALGAVVLLVGLGLPRLGRGRLAPLAAGVREARRLACRPGAGPAGAVLWWAGDVAVLWACFEAFGESPALAVVVMAYFVGMLANALPLPGGIGGVDGGMVAALVAFGTDPALAVVAVLAYRGFAFWLPILPGAAAWISLRRTVAGWESPVSERPRQPPAPAPVPVPQAAAA